jgi:hypothetical protein
MIPPHWSFARYESISIISILHYIHNSSTLPSCFSIHHKLKNSDLTSFVVYKISLTLFFGRVSSSDKRSYTWCSPWTIQIFSISILFNKFIYSFFTQELLLVTSYQTHYVQTIHDKCTTTLFSVSPTSRVVELNFICCLFI